MKKILYLLLLALMPMCFTACGGDDSNGGRDGDVVGTWTGAASWSSSTTLVYRFESNGDCYFNEWWYDESPDPKYFGTWSTDNGYITINEIDKGELEDQDIYRYEITNGGKTMTFYKKDDNGEYTKVRGVYTKQ